MLSVPRRFFSIGLISAMLVAPALGAWADAAPNAGQFINRLVNSALQVLAERDLSAAQREQSFDRLLTENFDLPRIARFVLGRYWATASEEDRRRFLDTYRQFIIKSYAAEFSGYSGEVVRVTGSRPESPGITIVTSEIVHPGGEPAAKVTWRVREANGDYKIVDVDVEGVSMMLAQREEFTSVIQRNGGTVAGLIQAMQQKLLDGAQGG